MGSARSLGLRRDYFYVLLLTYLVFNLGFGLGAVFGIDGDWYRAVPLPWLPLEVLAWSVSGFLAKNMGLVSAPVFCVLGVLVLFPASPRRPLNKKTVWLAALVGWSAGLAFGYAAGRGLIL